MCTTYIVYWRCDGMWTCTSCGPGGGGLSAQGGAGWAVPRDGCRASVCSPASRLRSSPDSARFRYAQIRSPCRALSLLFPPP